MEELREGRLSIFVDGPASDYGNNIYLVIDRETNEAAFIDAPGEPERGIAMAESSGVRPAKVLLTHSHPDHTAGLEAINKAFDCRLYADAREPWLPSSGADVFVEDGQEIHIGKLRLTVHSVPGHTPGSTTFALEGHAFVGDTLFPGGPGRSGSAEDLQEELRSITGVLYELPDETVIWPGHGDKTTIGASKQEYALFASKSHDSGLHGDVTWDMN
ncbi:MAG TPA: MBL fold metallo-hydrolase [Dehalococcoidia bacterium]|nr:MBL fold metallo-hydrolase [Dehalococcoidia bacterium]